MTPEVHDRMCPSCKARHRVPPTRISTNYDALPIDREQWQSLRRAAEAFDRRASNLDAEEFQSGAGDGETLFTAATFIDWIKPDCLGFRNLRRYEAEGAPPRNSEGSVYRHPDPIPYHKRPKPRSAA